MPQARDTTHEPSPEPAIEDDFVTAVLTASRVLVAISARSLGEVAEQLTLPQFRMLVVLDSRGPLSLSRLSEHLAVNPSTAMRMVDRLTAAGMLAREASPTDRREVRLVLTDAGARTVAEVTERRRVEIARVVDAMPKKHRAGLVEALRAFAAANREPDPGHRVLDVLGW